MESSSRFSNIFGEVDICLLDLFDGIPTHLGDKAVAQVCQECQVAKFHDS